MWEKLAIGIVLVIMFIFAPFMTVGIIFFMAGGVWSIFGFISFIIGVLRMLGKIFGD